MPVLEYKFLHLALELNALLDTGEYDRITIADAKRAVHAGALGEFFAGMGKHTDVSIIEDEDWESIAREWEGYADAVDEKRKGGLENRGLCLLLSYSLMSMRERQEEARRNAQ